MKFRKGEILMVSESKMVFSSLDRSGTDSSKSVGNFMMFDSIRDIKMVKMLSMSKMSGFHPGKCHRDHSNRFQCTEIRLQGNYCADPLSFRELQKS